LSDRRLTGRAASGERNERYEKSSIHSDRLYRKLERERHERPCDDSRGGLSLP
jgi:hypothetical protein